MSRPQVSIVVPTYREEANVRKLATRVRTALGPRGIAYELILVDDDSQDGTEETVGGLAREGHPVRLIIRKYRRDLSSAAALG